MIKRKSLKNIFNWKILYIFIPVLSIQLVPILSNYINNKNLVYINELWLPLAASFIIAAVITASTLFFYKNITNKLVMVAVFVSLFVSNFQLKYEALSVIINALLPFGTVDVLVTYLVLLATMVTISVIFANLFSKLLSRWKNGEKGFLKFILVFTTFLLISGFIGVFRNIINYYNQLTYEPNNTITKSSNTTAKSKPNIYYIVLDRHANATTLKEELGYDSSGFTNSLKNNGFYVNENAHSTYPFTSLSLASTLSANNLNELEDKFSGSKDNSDVPLFELSRNSRVINELKKNGYSYTLIGNYFSTSNKSELADRVYAEEMNLNFKSYKNYLGSFENNYLAKSIFNIPLYRAGIYNTQDPAERSKYQLNKLVEIADEDTTQSKVVFAHILLPHDPYVFNADGSLSIYDPGSNSIGATIQQKYLGQVEFIDNQISNITKEIVTKDPSAVIILQADEGMYPEVIQNDVLKSPSGSSANMTKWEDNILKSKFSILAAYRLPGIDATEYKNINSTNVFRVILNNYLSYDLPYLPTCNFALDKGPPNYSLSLTNVTGRVSGSENKECNKFHD